MPLPRGPAAEPSTCVYYLGSPVLQQHLLLSAMPREDHHPEPGAGGGMEPESQIFIY